MLKGSFGIVLGTVAEASAWSSGRIFGPELEAAFYTQGREKTRVDGGWRPLQLWDRCISGSDMLEVEVETIGSDAHLKDFSSMGCPGVTYPPCAVLVAVKHPDLAIDRSCSTSIAITIEGDGLNQILMAMFRNKFES